MGFMTVDESTYAPISGFTTVDLGCERGNNAYDNFVKQVAELQGEEWNANCGAAENVAQSLAREKLKKQIAALENKMKKEKQLNRRMEINAELKRMRRELMNCNEKTF